MGIPKKGTRKVNVDGKDYRYLIKQTHVPDHKDQKELVVTIQEITDSPGRVAQFRVEYGTSIHKPDIVLNIQEAIKHGWVPSERGSAFNAAEWKWAKVNDRKFLSFVF